MNARILNARILALVLTACSLMSMRAAIRYDVVSIWPEPGTTVGINVHGINNAGDVVGIYNAGLEYGPFLYSDASGFQPFPNAFEFTPSTPLGVSDDRQMVIYQSGREIYRYSSLGTYSALAEVSVGHENGSRGPHMNSSGQISFTHDVNTPGIGYLPQAAVFTPGQGIQNFGLFNGNRTWANDLNNQGWVVGASGNGTGGDRHAHLWREGSMTTLPMREAYAINDNGMIAGVTDSLQPVVLKDGQLVPIPIQGIFYSDLAINNSGLVIGTGSPDGVFSRPFLWSEGDGTTDLNNLIDPASGWVLREVRGINDQGQIIGWGEFNGQQLVFRLDPVPEPGTWALLGLGFISAWLIRRRRSL